MADQMMPMWGFGILPGPDGKHKVVLEITTGYTRNEFYLCNASDYLEIGRKIYDGIMEAGKEAARLDSGLVTVNGDVRDNAEVIRAAQRQQRRKSSQS